MHISRVCIGSAYGTALPCTCYLPWNLQLFPTSRFHTTAACAVRCGGAQERELVLPATGAPVQVRGAASK
eukprot:6173465-Pleurochrysis_carterae.AAC.2